MNPWSNPDALPPQDAANLAIFIDERGRNADQALAHTTLIDTLNPRSGERLIGVSCGLEAQQAALIEESEWLADELGLLFGTSGASTLPTSVAIKGTHPWQGCMRPWILMYITANGTALPCCISPFAAADYSSIMLGNSFARPLAEVWEGTRYQDIHSAVLRESPAPWPCQSCGMKWSL